VGAGEEKVIEGSSLLQAKGGAREVLGGAVEVGVVLKLGRRELEPTHARRWGQCCRRGVLIRVGQAAQDEAE
jgi:hypothetical protein